MRKFIVSSLELISQIAIFLALVSGLLNGVMNGGAGGGVGGAIIGGIVGFTVALMGCVLFFGAIFLLMDIADNTRRTAESVEAMRRHQGQ